jgi:hypothetical protein
MKILAVILAVCTLSWPLAGCLELDFSRINGNQKADDTTETVE